MTKLRIKIGLLSDLCCHSGEVYNTTVDADVVYDSYGIPYIPAKRIKGCIREAALELKDLGLISNYDAIFGKEGNDESLFTLSNAKINKYDEVVNAINAFAQEKDEDNKVKEKNKDIVEQQKVLQQYTYIRTQTAVNFDTGSAIKNSLRTIRVVKSGQIFNADCDFKGNRTQLEEFKNAISIVKHMGVSRTRGLGLVNLTVEEIDEEDVKHVNIEKKNLYENNEIEYTIKLESPIICKSSEGNQAKSEDYIAGSKILGVIAGSMGKDEYRSIMNDITVSNAYIASNNKRTNPGRNSWQKIKNQKYVDGEMELTDMIYFDESDGEQRSPANIKYISEDGTVKSVDTEISYHHQRPIDKSIGRATDSSGSFYQLGSICEGQVFKGYIRANKEVAEKVIDSISKLGNVRIGYGKNSEFGQVQFTLDAVKEVKENPQIIKDVDLLLASDLIVYNDNGMLVADIETLEKYLRDFFDCDDIKINKPFLSYSTIGGFNVTWRSRKPIFTALAKGSVMQLHSDKGFDASLNYHYFMAERTSEGYGEFILEESKKENKTITTKKDLAITELNEISDVKIKDYSIIHDLLKKECLKIVDEKIRGIVMELGTIDNPALSKIRLLFRNSEIDKEDDHPYLTTYRECKQLNSCNKEKCLKLLEKVHVRCKETSLPDDEKEFVKHDLLDEAEEQIKNEYWQMFELNWNEKEKYHYLYNSYITELKNVNKKGVQINGND